MKNKKIIINRVLKGNCPICNKEITDVKLNPVIGLKSVMFEGFEVFICAHHPNMEA